MPVVTKATRAGPATSATVAVMPTALVTGATSGIGYAFARALARSGHRLIIVARDADRLEQRRSEFTALGAPDVETIDVDLTDREARQRVSDRLSSAENPVDLLVNNAGSTLGVDFLQASESDLYKQLELNAVAVMSLTHAVLPGMLARGHGGVINVASTAGLVPGRGSTYGASKAFVISLSEALATALRGSGVRVQALCPGFVRTEFHQRAGIDMSSTPPWAYVDDDYLVANSLADLRANRPLSIPGPLYKTIYLLTKVLPRTVIRRAASKVNSRGRT